MENGKIKVWLPTIRTGSGTDIFTRRFAEALERSGLVASISWFPRSCEPIPLFLAGIPPPLGTDIIFANSWNGFAFKRGDLPLVVTIHHAAFDPNARDHYNLFQRLYHGFLIRPFEKFSFRVADAITAVSDFAATSAAQATGINHIQVIHNWVDVVRFCPKLKRSPDSRPFRLLFVGKLSRLKGADLLAPIMIRLGADFELHIAGALNSFDCKGCPENIQSLGWLNEEQLIQAYYDCDALLFPSRFEGFGYAALEAMACGKPVIASCSSALPEVVEDGITGILCPMDDISAFVAACKTLGSNPDQRIAMGSAGRQRAMKYFSEQAVIPRYIALIQSLVNPC